MADVSIDLDSFFRNKIEALLIVSSWSEQFRKDIGLKGASQVWGRRPAWYFWLSPSPGVYQLEMMPPEETGDSGQGRYRAVFKVKCYPCPECSDFASFSFLERELVKSRLFDDTHTPKFDHQDDIPEGIFTVATIEFSMDSEEKTAVFSFESMARLQTRYEQEGHQTFPILGLKRTFDCGEVDREVPGIQMGYPLFDCLMSMYANTHKQAPLKIRCSESPGFEVAIKGEEACARSTDSIKGLRLSVLYSAAAACPFLEKDSVFETFQEGGDSLIYDRGFTCGHFHESSAEQQLPVGLNRQWWSLAQGHYPSELASTCGCH